MRTLIVMSDLRYGYDHAPDVHALAHLNAHGNVLHVHARVLRVHVQADVRAGIRVRAQMRPTRNV